LEIKQGVSGCFHGEPTAAAAAADPSLSEKLILLRFEYILFHESRYPGLLTALLLVRFNEDDGLKMVLQQETSPTWNIPVVFP